MTNASLPEIDMHLLGDSSTGGWWAAHLQVGAHRRIYAGNPGSESLAASLQAGMEQVLNRLRHACHVRLHAPPRMSCPQKFGDHQVEHVKVASQGALFDELRRFQHVMLALTPLPAGRERLAHLFISSIHACAAWLAISIGENGTFAQASIGIEQTTETRLALQALAQGIKIVAPPPAPMCIMTDSDYVLSGQSGLIRWASSNWKGTAGQAIKNVDLWRDVHERTQHRPVAWARLTPVQTGHLHSLIRARIEASSGLPSDN